MGVLYSVLSANRISAVAPPPEPGLGNLPESCVALVLSRLDPSQICQLALLNRAFSGASSADFLWKLKLPTNYEDIIRCIYEKKEVDFSKAMRKKDIYAMLCRAKTFDGGTKRMWLDKKTGKACVSISSNGLAITGIDDRRYWTRIPTEESRFRSVAYLHQIWWFEIYGEIDFPFPAGSYSLFFRLQLGHVRRRFGRRICNSECIHGWDKKPAEFHFSTSDGQKATRQWYLKEPAGKWIYYQAGDFVVADDSKSMKIKFSMTQIDCTHTKGGLCVDSVVICPVGSIFNGGASVY